MNIPSAWFALSSLAEKSIGPIDIPGGIVTCTPLNDPVESVVIVS